MYDRSKACPPQAHTSPQQEHEFRSRAEKLDFGGSRWLKPRGAERPPKPRATPFPSLYKQAACDHRHSTNRSMEFPGLGVVLLAQEGFATGHDYAVKSATPGGELCTGNLYA